MSESARELSMNSAAPSPRNFSDPMGTSPQPPVVVPGPPLDEVAAEGIRPGPLPLEKSTPVASVYWAFATRPPSFMKVLRNVGVSPPIGLALLRLVQLLFAGSIIGCLVWVLMYDDFSGYHGANVALLFAAAWTIVPTFVVSWPYTDLRHVLDPRLTLFADGLACILWAMTFAASNAVQWNRETRAKFWATAEGRHGSHSTPPPVATLTMSAMPHVTSIVARILNGPTLPAVAVPTSVITDPFPIDPVGRSLMPHEAVTLSSRGTRIGDDGLVSNHDANAAWKLGLIASYFGAAEFVLFAITTTIFAYYYHSALVADMVSRTIPRVSAVPAANPSTTLGRVEAGASFVEADHLPASKL